MKIIATSLSLLLPVLYWLRNGSFNLLVQATTNKAGVKEGRTGGGLLKDAAIGVGAGGILNDGTPTDQGGLTPSEEELVNPAGDVPGVDAIEGGLG